MEYMYNEENDVWGFPQTYKGIEFHPIKLSDFLTEKLFYRIFGYPKEYIKEKEIIKLSYLKYILYYVPLATKEDSSIVQNNLENFFKKICKTDKVSLEVQKLDFIKNEIDSILLSIKINGVSFNEEDFDILREMILKQNGSSVRYIEDFDPTLEEKLNWFNRKTEGVTFEDQLVTYCALSKIPICDDSIKNMTIYQFKKSFQRLALLLDYENLFPLEISGQIKSKTGKEIVKHYMSHIAQEGRYDSILISKDDFMNNHPLMKENNLKNEK